MIQEVIFEQEISSELLENVNISDNLFGFEVELKSTGYEDSNLIVGESGYSTVMSDNTAIKGMYHFTNTLKMYNRTNKGAL